MNTDKEFKVISGRVLWNQHWLMILGSRAFQSIGLTELKTSLLVYGGFVLGTYAEDALSCGLQTSTEDRAERYNGTAAPLRDSATAVRTQN